MYKVHTCPPNNPRGIFSQKKKNLTSLVFPFGPTPSFFGRRVGSEFAFRPCMVYAQRCIRTYACKYINRLNYQMHHPELILFILLHTYAGRRIFVRQKSIVLTYVADLFNNNQRNLCYT